MRTLEIMPPISYEYRFNFPNGSVKEFVLKLDERTLLLIPQNHNFAKWAELQHNQCSCCPLQTDKYKYCPIAVNLSELVIEFKDTVSYESCHVSCQTAERTIIKDTIVQEGLSSIMGIIMATSGCPIMDILKPMARYHLPFATVEEAMFRSISVYLLRQYFIYQERGDSDFHLENVKEYYSRIQIVNSGILKRIKQAAKMDADGNAIVILNCLAQILYVELDDNLQSLQHIFTET